MPTFQTGISFSWNIISRDEAIKHCDKTIFNDHQTGIPKEKVRAFFEIEGMQAGNELDIQLEMNYIAYPAKISVEIRDSARAKLKWNKELGTILDSYKGIQNTILHFEKITPRYYRIKIIIEDKQLYPHIEHSYETYVEVPSSTGSKDGKKIAMYVQKYERDPKNRSQAIRIHGTTCQACGFDFSKQYGKLGEGYIEVHHKKPLFSLKEEVEIDPEKDLVCVCANCHKMLHHNRNQILTLKELRKIIKETNA